MKVGIAGLGLIGGSLAKAYEKSGAAVYGYDGNRVVQDFAKLQGTLTGDLDRETIGGCDLLLDRVKKLLTPAGFSHMTVTTAEHHDAMIAYTSQMCHVLSNAYVKSPRAQMHKGYSAGSYRDLTRVAWLNETMWTDLFLENRDYLLEELDRLIGYLGEYREALEQGNGTRLCTLLAEGRICKEKVDAE